MAAAAPDAGLSSTIKFPVSRDLMDEIDARIQRGDLRMREEIFDAALNAMLDQLESTPPSSTCALCVNLITGGARLLPIGKDDAMVWICYACDTEHPRKGRYSYDGGREKGQQTSALNHGRDANGNHQKGNGIR